jgi:hypothetical protein
LFIGILSNFCFTESIKEMFNSIFIIFFIDYNSKSIFSKLAPPKVPSADTRAKTAEGGRQPAVQSPVLDPLGFLS